MLTWLEQTTGSQEMDWKGGCKSDHRRCVIPWAAITIYHKPSSSDNRNFSCHSSGSQKSKIKVLAGLVPSKGCEGESIPCLCHRFWWFVGNLLHSSPCLQAYHPDLCFMFTWHSPSVCLFLSKFPIFIRTYSIRSPTYSRMTSFQIMTFIMILFPHKATF